VRTKLNNSLTLSKANGEHTQPLKFSLDVEQLHLEQEKDQESTVSPVKPKTYTSK